MARETAKLTAFLPTKGRVDHQMTLAALPEFWQRRTIIVCPADEVKAHKKNWSGKGVMVIPQGKDVRGIADARAWVFRHAHAVGLEKIVMLDDDIRFAARKARLARYLGIGACSGAEWETAKAKNPDLGRLVNIAEDDQEGRAHIGQMMQGLETMLTKYAHAGMHGRLMSNQHAFQWRANTRIQQIYAYHVPTVMKHCEVGRKIMRDDFDYELQLLEAGFECVVYCWLVGEQGRGFHGKGGQDSSRTLQINNRDAHRLAELHPGFVKVVERNYNRMPRLETIVYWQKAAKHGQAKKFLGEESFL